MRASSLRIQQQMRSRLREAAVDSILRDGEFGPRRAGGKLLALLGISSDGQFDDAVPSLWNTPHDRFIHAAIRVLLELSAQMPMRLVRLGNHHDAGRVLV